MTIKIDILGYRYDDREPAFTIVESGQFYYHLATRRLFNVVSFNKYLEDNQTPFPPGELGFPPGQLGLPSEEAVEVGEDQLENLFLFSHAQLRDVGENDHHNKVHLLNSADHGDVEEVADPEIGSAFVWNGSKFEPLNIFTTATYGGVALVTPAAMADLGLGYAQLPTDTVALTTPRGVIQDLATDSIAFEYDGVYQVTVNFTLAHNELNGSRNIRARFYNITAGTAGLGTAIGIGRNTDVVNASFTVLIEIGDAAPASSGDAFRVEIGGGDDVSAVVLESYEMSAISVGEYRG